MEYTKKSRDRLTSHENPLLTAAVRCQSPTSLLTNKMLDMTTVKKCVFIFIDTIINHYRVYIYIPSVYFMTITKYSITIISASAGVNICLANLAKDQHFL